MGDSLGGYHRWPVSVERLLPSLHRRTLYRKTAGLSPKRRLASRGGGDILSGPMAGAPQRVVGPLRDRLGAVRYSNLEYRLLTLSGQAIGDFSLIEPGDRLLVAVSGGPASVALCALLEHHRRRFDYRFELLPLHLEEGRRPHGLEELLESWGMKLQFVQLPGGAKTRGAPATAACRLRLRALWREAKNLGCNKIADGRLLDDFLEQLFLNLQDRGKLAALAVKKAGSGGITLVRPLVYVERRQVVTYCQQLGWAQGGHPGQVGDQALERVRRQLGEFSRDQPRIKVSLLAALRNVRVSHLLDLRFYGKDQPSRRRDGK